MTVALPQNEPRYLPTPEEIAAECEAIRAEWKDVEAHLAQPLPITSWTQAKLTIMRTRQRVAKPITVNSVPWQK